MKTLRKSLIALIAVLAAILMTFGFAAFSAHAEEADPDAFGFDESKYASIRYANADEDIPNGLRFKLHIGSKVKTEIEKEDVRLGVLIIPAKYYKDFKAQSEIDDFVEYLVAKKNGTFKNVYLTDNAEEIRWMQAEEGGNGYFVLASLDDVRFENVNLEFVAVGYLAQLGDEPYIIRYTEDYSAEFNGASIASIAKAATAAGEGTDEQKAFLADTVKASYFVEKGVTGTEGNYSYSGNTYATLDEIPVPATYTVEHYKKVEGEYTLDETETKDSTAGATVSLNKETFKAYNGMFVNTTAEGTVTEAKVVWDGSAKIKLYYDEAMPIEGTDGKGHIADLSDNKSGAFTTALVKYEGEVGGKSDVWKYNGGTTLRIAGFDVNDAKAKGYKTFSIMFYYDGDIENVVATSYYGGAKHAASIYMHGDLCTQRDYIAIYNIYGVFCNQAFAKHWYKLVINLEGIDNNASALGGINMEISNSVTHTYFAEAKMSTEEFGVLSPLAVSNSEGKAYFLNLASGQVTGGEAISMENVGTFEGVDNAVKVQSTTGAGAHDVSIYIQGVNKQWLQDKGLTKLKMKVYVEQASGSDPALFVMKADGYVPFNSGVNAYAASLGSTGDMSNNKNIKTTKLDGSDATNNIVAPGEWFVIEFDISQASNVYTSGAKAYDILGVRIRVSTTFATYFADAEFVA